MRIFVLGIGAALCSLMLMGSAKASDYGWPQTQYPSQGHSHYQPGHFDRHGNHRDYVPGHFDYHRGRDFNPGYTNPNPLFNTYQNNGCVTLNTGSYQQGGVTYPTPSYPSRPGHGY